MAHNRPTIAYVGPIAPPGQPARGGFESANRRLIDDLRVRGLPVREYAYAPERTWVGAKALSYGQTFLALAARLLVDAHRYDIVHITPLRRHFGLAEVTLCRLVKARGRKLVLDLRAGDLKDNLDSPKRLERQALETMLGLADLVAIEGLNYAPLVERFSADPFYLPNYVDAVSAAPARQPGPHEPIRLVFLGRVVPEKGIEIALATLRALTDGGPPAHLSVFGRGDPAYINRLTKNSADLPVGWVGPIPWQEVPARIAGAHFFVFATTHDGEGHSNALTEAMAQGLVPIASDNGFNRTVVGDAGVVLPASAQAKDYAGAITDIWDRGAWPQLSRAARNRVAERYLADKVVPSLIERYRALLEP